MKIVKKWGALIAFSLVSTISLLVHAGGISSTWNQMNFPDDTFWNDNPTTGEIIKAYFGTSGDRVTAFTQYRSGQTHNCDFDAFQVVALDAGSGDQLPSAWSGNTLYVLSGTFSYTGSKTMGSCIGVIGSTNTMLVATGYTNRRFDMQAISGIILHRFIFDGVTPTTALNGNIVLLDSGSANMTISHITGTNSVHGIGSQGVISNSYLNILNSTFISNGGCGIIIGVVRNYRIANNRFISNGGASGVGNNHCGVDIRSNSANSGIIENNIFSGNNVSSVTKGLWIEGGSFNHTIRNNEFYNNYRGIRADSVSGVLIENNYFDAHTENSIFLNSNANRLTFSGNTFSGSNNPNSVGVAMHGSQTGINNIFINNRLGAYMGAGSTGRLLNSTFVNNQVGIWVVGSTTNFHVIDGAKIYNGGSGILSPQIGAPGGIGIMCQSCTRVRMNNLAIFNQDAAISMGLNIASTGGTVSGLIISNSQLYNNGYALNFTVASGRQYIHNTQIYNNGTGIIGITGTVLNNVGLFNNTFNGSGGTVYGTLSVLGSGYNPHSIGSGSDALVANVGWATGSINTITGEMSCEYASIPRRGWYPGLSPYGWYPGSNACGAVGKVSTDSGTNTQYPATGFIIGQNILLQVDPVRLSGSILVLDTGLSINTGYYIALLDDNHDFVDFTPVTGVQFSTLMTSNTGIIQGITTTATISVSGGEMSINGGAFTSTPTTVSSGDSVRVRGTGASAYATTTAVTITIGSAQSSFLITTLLDTAPDAFSFTNVTNASLDTGYPSNTITLTGMSSGAFTGISISGGTYRINGGAFTGTTGFVTQGDTITVYLTSANSYSTALSLVLTIGDLSASYSVTTQDAPSAGGGGGSSSSSSPSPDNCPNGDFSASNYDSTCGSSTSTPVQNITSPTSPDSTDPETHNSSEEVVSEQEKSCLVIPSNLTYQQRKVKASFDKLITPYQSSPSNEKLFLTNLQIKTRTLMQQAGVNPVILVSDQNLTVTENGSSLSSALVSRARGVGSLLQFFDFLVSKRLQQLENNGQELVGRPSPDQIAALLNEYKVTSPEFIQTLMSDALFTREEAAYFYADFAEKVLCKKPIVPRSLCLFNDLPKSNPLYTEAIIRSCELGIFEGFEDGSFQPKNLFVGKEVVTTVIRLIYDGSIVGISGENWYQPFLDKASAIKLTDQFHNSQLFLENGVDKFGVASLVYRAPFVWAF